MAKKLLIAFAILIVIMLCTFGWFITLTILVYSLIGALVCTLVGMLAAALKESKGGIW